jgi:hypothetical protein
MQRERNDPRRNIVSHVTLDALLCSMIVRAATCSTPSSLHSAVSQTVRVFSCTCHRRRESMQIRLKQVLLDLFLQCVKTTG